MKAPVLVVLRVSLFSKSKNTRKKSKPNGPTKYKEFNFFFVFNTKSSEILARDIYFLYSLFVTHEN